MREVVLEKTEAIKRREGGTKRESKKSFIQHLHFAAQELQTGKSFSNPPPCILIPLFLLQARMNSSRTFANKKKRREKRLGRVWASWCVWQNTPLCLDHNFYAPSILIFGQTSPFQYQIIPKIFEDLCGVIYGLLAYLFFAFFFVHFFFPRCMLNLWTVLLIANLCAIFLLGLSKMSKYKKKKDKKKSVENLSLR
jgi:hypothetical protein